MIHYLFNCPFPCNNKIQVNADNRDDAVSKIMLAGAMSCRNLDNQCFCKKENLNLYPIPLHELRNTVNLTMQTSN